jgi:hypothetical protein
MYVTIIAVMSAVTVVMNVDFEWSRCENMGQEGKLYTPAPVF